MTSDQADDELVIEEYANDPYQRTAVLPGGLRAHIGREGVAFHAEDGRRLMLLTAEQLHQLTGAQSDIWQKLRPINGQYAGILMDPYQGRLQTYAPPCYDGRGPRLRVYRVALVEGAQDAYILWVIDRVTGELFTIENQAGLDAMREKLLRLEKGRAG